MNNHIQLVLKSSTTELSLNDRELGIYVVPQLDGLTGLPEIRTTSGVNSGYDGGWTSAQNYDARSITIRGVIANEDVATVERLRRQLVSLAGQGKNEELTLDLVTEAGNSYTLQVRTIALEMAMQRVLKQQEFMLQLRADDPLIYDNSEQTHEALIQVAKATGGFRIDFALPLAIDGGSEETIVSNEGLEEVPTITRMYGALHNPKIINHTTNQSMQITADLGYAQGEPINPRDAEGSNIAIDDAIEAPFNNIELLGNTEQVAYTGKNLLIFARDLTQTLNGITVVYDPITGIFTISGTCTKDNTVIPFFTSTDYSITLNGTYTASSIYVSGTTNRTGELAQFMDNSYGNRIALAVATSSATLTKTTATKTNITYNRCNMRFDNGNTFTNYQVKFMLEQGSTASDFEPYVGGTASPNPDYPQTVRTTTGRQVVIVDNGVALNLEQGTIAGVSGEPAAADNRVRTADFMEAKELTDYKLDIQADYGDSDAIVFCYDINKNYIERTYQGFLPSDSTFTTLEGTKFVKVTLKNTGTTINITPANITRAAIYTQGYSHEINLGKNLLNAQLLSPAAVEYGLQVDERGNVSDSSPTSDTRDWTYNNNTWTGITLEAGTYTASINMSVRCSYSAGSFRAYTVNGTALWTTSNNLQNVDKLSYTFTLAEKTTIGIGLKIFNGVGTVQLEKGSQATEYAPYFNPIELCKLGTYQDYIYKQDGKWFVHKEVGKYTLDGSHYPGGVNTSQVNTARFIWPNSGIDPINEARSLAVCDHFAIVSNWSRDEVGLFFESGTNNVWFRVLKSVATTSEGIADWLKLNNVNFYYVLATPTDTEITYEPLIEQLNNLQWGGTLKGINNISVDSPEIQGILDLSYFTDRNPDRRDEIVIDSRLKTITLNGLDIYNLKTEGSEFLTLAPGENKLSLQSDINGDNGYAEISYKQGYLSI